jgi:urease accessory protein
MTAWPRPGLCEPAMQRAVGGVRIEARGGANGTVLHDLAQSGCLRACFPRRHGGPLEAVIVNTAGGVADGDRLGVAITAGAGADMVVTTPSAERIYRARTDAAAAQVDIVLRVGAGARLGFLPQETLLFDRCALDRTLLVELAGDGCYVGVEALVFGRAAFGETLDQMRLRDTIRLRRDGRLLLHDAVRLQGEVGPHLAAAASACGGRAVATVMGVAPDIGLRLEPLRAVLGTTALEAGVSAWDGMLVARLLAADAQALRRGIVAALAVLRPDAALPRVWSS